MSIYTPWVLHEPKPGSFQAEGVFDYEPFFEAAKKAGVYLVAVCPVRLAKKQRLTL